LALATMIALLVVVAATLMAASPDAQATLPGRNGHLLLFLNPLAGGSDQLWLSGPSGQQPHKLLTGPACNLSQGAQFTRSGKQIIFQEVLNCSPPSLDYGVAVVNADGTGLRLLAKFSTPIPPQNAAKLLPGIFAVSSDGRTLTYGFDEYPGIGEFARHEVLIINIKTGRTERSFTLPDPGSGPLRIRLSGPVGSSSGNLVFFSLSGVVETTRADGSHRRQIKIKFPGPVSAQITAQNVAPSPDGSQFAVVGVAQGAHGGNCGESTEPSCPSDIYVVGAAGGRAKRVTHSGEADAPVWSPDGHQIAFHDGLLNKILTLPSGHVKTLYERIPSGGLGVTDWQALP
jgi:hypothetical protein